VLITKEKQEGIGPLLQQSSLYLSGTLHKKRKCEGEPQKQRKGNEAVCIHMIQERDFASVTSAHEELDPKAISFSDKIVYIQRTAVCEPESVSEGADKLSDPMGNICSTLVTQVRENFLQIHCGRFEKYTTCVIPSSL
jgi:hypothetical protein